VKNFLRLLFLSSVPLFAQDLQLVPSPNPSPFSTQSELQSSGNHFNLTSSTRIFYKTIPGIGEHPSSVKSLKPLAHLLAEEIEILKGIRPKVTELQRSSTPQANDILLSASKGKGGVPATEAEEDHSYQIDCAPFGGGEDESGNMVDISSATYRGVALGTTTLLQALALSPNNSPSLPRSLNEEPSSDYRCLMLDVARRPHSAGVIKDCIRLCRLYKIRYLQLHLTDDQLFTFPFKPITDKIENNKTYTREELLDLVAYADARGVTLVPELDLPGHSSRLRQSGYLSPTKNDADVAHPDNYAKIHAIIDDMLSVFASSPYFHIGGDESAAGHALVPFLKSMNEHVRKRGRRLLVWEGFHGSPTKDLPATGDDRIIVLSWESTYNAPWDLLNSGYQIVNASWKPLYIVGGYGDFIHPGSSGGRKFTPADIYRWDKNTFMHWEPGRPVYEDRGPNDPVKGDAQWNAKFINKQDQVIGGQMLFWEQEEETVIKLLRHRLPVMAERLWNPDSKDTFEQFQKRAKAVDAEVMKIVQPVQILPEPTEDAGPITDIYQPYQGKEIEITLKNRTKLPGVIKYSVGSFQNDLTGPKFSDAPEPHLVYEKPFKLPGGFSIRAQLFSPDGKPIDGQTWEFFNNWENRVKVTEYEIPRSSKQEVPDLLKLPKSAITKTYQMPMLRGPMRNVELSGQLLISDLIVPKTGDYRIVAKTQSGHANVYLDLNQNETWEDDEKLITNTPNSEAPITSKTIILTKGQRYGLRVDHKTGMPRPVVLVYLKKGEERKREISSFLKLPQR